MVKKIVNNVKNDEALTKRKLSFTLISLIVILAIMALLLIFLFNPALTGNLISIDSDEEYTGKVCNYDVGSTTIAMFSCNDKLDCENKKYQIQDNEEINRAIDIRYVEVIDCVEME